jgi:hypothetical protein
MLLLLPVILVPLMSIGFYALGGGQGDKSGKGVRLTKGLNMSLPEAKFDQKKKGLNKLGLYKQSEQDSIRLREQRKMDPYYGIKDSAGGGSTGAGDIPRRTVLGGLTLERGKTDSQANVLLRKLEQLKGVLSRQEHGEMPEMPPSARLPGAREYPRAISPIGPSMPVTGLPMRVGAGDPDLDKLNSLMDKVLKVRQAGDVPLRDTSIHGVAPSEPEGSKVQVLSSPVQEEAMTTFPSEDTQDMGTGFIDLDEGTRKDSLAETMIAAIVDGSQTLLSGEAVDLRTSEEAVLAGMKVPRGTSLSGKAVLSGERLLVTANAIRLGNRVVPVSLEVLDMDGIAGIRVKGSINRDVSKESASEAVGSVGIAAMDPSVAGQATAAGIQAAKNLLGRKIRLVRVGLPAGYRVFLKNNKANH